MNKLYGLVLIAIAATPLMFSLGCSYTETMSSNGEGGAERASEEYVKAKGQSEERLTETNTSNATSIGIDPEEQFRVDKDRLARQVDRLAATDVFQTPFNVELSADTETGNSVLRILRPTDGPAVGPGRVATELLATVVFKGGPDGEHDELSLSSHVETSDQFKLNTLIAQKLLVWMRTNRLRELEFRCRYFGIGEGSGEVDVEIAHLPLTPDAYTWLTYNIKSGQLRYTYPWSED
ncbi:MAG: hypothetical protein IH944_12260 [Armatimonadetes bacterium]|nr:hypothetical protein [Armatimonadota bacterium]